MYIILSLFTCLILLASWATLLGSLLVVVFDMRSMGDFYMLRELAAKMHRRAVIAPFIKRNQDALGRDFDQILNLLCVSQFLQRYFRILCSNLRMRLEVAVKLEIKMCMVVFL